MGIDILGIDILGIDIVALPRSVDYLVKFKKKSYFIFFELLPFANLAIANLIVKMIIDRSFKFGQLFRMMKSIARSFKHKTTLVLKSTILVDKQMVGGTVFHKHNF